MFFEISEFNTGVPGVYVRLPVFGADGNESGDRKVLQNIERMNAFYKSLAEYIGKYAASEAFPSGGRYRADGICRADTEGENFTVTVRLSLHHRGRCTSQKNVTHTWHDGVII